MLIRPSVYSEVGCNSYAADEKPAATPPDGVQLTTSITCRPGERKEAVRRGNVMRNGRNYDKKNHNCEKKSKLW